MPGSKKCPKGVCGVTPSVTLRVTPNPDLHLDTFGHGQQRFWASVRGLIAEFCYSQAAIFETPHAVSRSFRFSPRFRFVQHAWKPLDRPGNAKVPLETEVSGQVSGEVSALMKG